MRIAAAGLLYFAIVFGTGFILGPIRVLWLEPRVGPLVATACEAPFFWPPSSQPPAWCRA
jgi:hypothetical protein